MLKRAGILILAFAMICSCLAVPAQADTVMVTRCNVRLREKASTSSNTLTTLAGGTEVTVHSTSGGWSKVTYGSRTGYVSSDYLMELTRSGYYPLREGDENPYVEALQLRLIELGYLVGKADGKFGDSTLEAVKAFQRSNNLTVDGIAGGGTQKVMYSASAVMASGSASGSASSSGSSSSSGTGAANGSTSTGNYTTLKSGMSGTEVKAVQERLIELGYLATTATGYYGTATTEAVRNFQKKHSLSVDGKAGQVTQSVLFSSSALSAGDSSSGSGSTGSGSGSSATTYTLLKRGMTSTEVKKLQEKLIELKYLSTTATGYYGSATYAAVKKYQQAHGLDDDGIAGQATQQMLYSGQSVSAGSSVTATPAPSGTYATLRQGQTSDAVKTMQQALKNLDYLSANATGYFGTATLAAVKEFQANNQLDVDGIAGNATLTLLYSGNAAKASSSGSSSSSATTSTGAGKISGPSKSQVKLLHWQNYVKGTMAYGDSILVFDPATNYAWNLKVYSRGRHLDAEPLTATDVTYMNAAFGGVTTWTPKVVYVKLSTGEWTMATTHNTPHLSGSISNNNFDGHLCVHFLRDMSEAKANDPNYGVTNQETLRKGWYNLTGETVN